MPYTADDRPPHRSSEELRARIPGWGADLDPADRPSYPKLRRDLETGAHWDFPERQPERTPRERSIEHRHLTPVFGTAQPLHGVSGMIRRRAYRYGEDKTYRWLMLLGADRVDAVGSHVRSLVTPRPDNPVTETGVVTEFTAGGLSSRVGKKRYDVRHHWIDPLLVGGPWAVAGGAAALGGARLLRGAKAVLSARRQ